MLVGCLAGSISRYEDPLAEGMRPVFRTRIHNQLRNISSRIVSILHIFRSSVGFLARCGLSAASPAAFRSKEANTGALVPLGGPLFLLLSAMFV